MFQGNVNAFLITGGGGTCLRFFDCVRRTAHSAKRIPTVTAVVPKPLRRKGFLDYFLPILRRMRKAPNHFRIAAVLFALLFSYSNRDST